VAALVVQETRLNHYRRLAEESARRAFLEVKAEQAAREAAEMSLKAAEAAMGKAEAK
jgi:hypothetical protein